ncbi:MAG TPA: alanyl-tRNA editing protein [Bryobacteraceae bacterium]|nr:alanyl-tRNA editing protein [Bryobacteraceae bacterium]
MTERLYYTDPYLHEFRARLVERVEQGSRIYLDRTPFYPTSGGQPHDLGTINGVEVVDVLDEGDRIAHILAPGQVADLPDTVDCRLDWLRRYDHMQQHTGQHLLSAVLVEVFGYPTLSFHMGAEVSSIELGTPDLNESQIEETERRVQELVWAARPVSIRFEEAGSAGGLRKASERAGTLRIIEIEGVDRSACGGTHVRSTAELGPIQIRKAEKIRGNVRIEFVCGQRARRRARQDFRLLGELSRQTSVAVDALPAHVAGLLGRVAEAEKERQRLALEFAGREAEALYDATPQGPDGLRRVLCRVPAIGPEERARASAFANRGKALALFVGANPMAVLVAASKDAGVDAGTVLKSALAALGGRGGGSPTLAQGSVPNECALEALMVALGMKMS